MSHLMHVIAAPLATDRWGGVPTYHAVLTCGCGDSVSVDGLQVDMVTWLAEMHIAEVAAPLAVMDLPVADAIREIHRPVTVEAEFYCFNDGSTVSFGCESYDDCSGHILPMECCTECGHDSDVDTVMYRAWPCPTIRAIGGSRG